MNSICNVYGKHSPQSKTSRCSSSSVTDRNMCSYSLGQRGEMNLQAGVENNTILFFQNSWLRTLCPKCSQVKHPSWFPALRGGKNSAAGLASNKQNLGKLYIFQHILKLWFKQTYNLPYIDINCYNQFQFINRSLVKVLPQKIFIFHIPNRISVSWILYIFLKYICAI